MCLNRFLGLNAQNHKDIELKEIFEEKNDIT